MHAEAQTLVQPLGTQIAVLKEQVENLEGWQQKQNGALTRVADQVDALKTWLMSILATALLAVLASAGTLLAMILKR